MRECAPPAVSVLVVDDDLPTLSTLADALEYEGYDVELATDGAAALALAAARPPALILLDVYMPGTDGPTFAKEYRRRPGAHAPLLVLTTGRVGRSAPDLSWADAVVAKPFDLDELLDTVARLVAAPEPLAV